jgi:hypothetical protein
MAGMGDGPLDFQFKVQSSKGKIEMNQFKVLCKL